MPLLRCPQCERNVSSVASTCPHCNHVIAEERWQRSYRVGTIECHRCRATIPAETSVCCNCGVLYPHNRQPLLSAPALIGAALVVIISVGSWTQIDTMVLGANGRDTQTRVLPATLAENDEAPVEAAPEEPIQPAAADTQVIAAAPPALDSVVPVDETVSAEVPPPPAPSTRSAQSSLLGDLPGTVTTRWTNNWVNIREDRSTTAPVVRVLNPGERVTVANRGGRWWEVYMNGRRIGYVANSVLSSAPPRSE